MAGHQASAAPPPSEKPRWRPVAFAVLTIAFVVIGVVALNLAQAGRESSALVRNAPQRVGIYVGQQHATVHLTAGLHWRPGHPVAETLYAAVDATTVSSHVPVLITSTVPPTKGTASWHRTHVLSGGDLAQSLPEWTWFGTVGRLGQQATPFGTPVGKFSLQGVVELSNGSLFAHLPALAPNVSVFPSLAVEVVEQSSQTGPVKDLVNFAEPRPGAHGTGPSYLGTAATQIPLYDPQTLMTTESISGLKPQLVKSVINSNLPGDGTLQGPDYVWQETGWLEGYLGATQMSATASQADWVFGAGVAFGVAAGGLLAFLQDPSLDVLFAGRRSRGRASTAEPRNIATANVEGADG